MGDGTFPVVPPLTAKAALGPPQDPPVGWWPTSMATGGTTPSCTARAAGWTFSRATLRTDTREQVSYLQLHLQQAPAP